MCSVGEDWIHNVKCIFIYLGIILGNLLFVINFEHTYLLSTLRALGLLWRLPNIDGVCQTKTETYVN